MTKARIEFTDQRWAKRFEKVPMRFPMIKIVGMLPAQIRQATGEIRIPPEAQDGDYDLVVIGSPTWWFRVSLPIRSYLKSPAARKVLDGKPFAAFSTSRRYWKHNVGDIRRFGEADGGTWIDETHFVALGNQVQSMLSWLSYMSGFTVLRQAAAPAADQPQARDSRPRRSEFAERSPIRRSVQPPARLTDAGRARRQPPAPTDRRSAEPAGSPTRAPAARRPWRWPGP